MTNKKQIIDRIRDNFAAKVICLIIAIFLYVFHQASLISKKTFVLPLNIVENGIVMHVGNTPSSISVIVRASDIQINSILNSDMKAYVNLDNISEKGTYELPVFVQLSDKIKEFDPFEIRIKDQTVSINVDLKATKYVDLKPSVVGEVAEGYKVSEVTMNPSVVQISGPQSVLNSINYLETTKINVSNAMINFSTDAYYINVSKIVKVIDEGPYRATVVVTPLDFEKEFAEIPVEVLHLSDELEISGQIPKIRLKLAGSMPDLKNYKLSNHAVQINLEEIKEPGTYTVSVIYNIPSSFEIIDKSDDTITISIVEKANVPEENTETTEEINVPMIEAMENI